MRCTDFCKVDIFGLSKNVNFVVLFLMMGASFLYAQQIKFPSVAGMFYPASKDKLQETIDSFLREANPDVEGDIVGIISPHAGYVYSGKVAAFAYKAIEGKDYDTVVVMGPSHYYNFHGAALWREGFLRTPLGDIEVDKEMVSSIEENFSSVTFEKRIFEREHSIEVELPFLQTVLKEFRVVPIIIGYMDSKEMERLAETLFRLSQRQKVLLVASSDLSHYHTYFEAEEIDSKTVECIKRAEVESFYEGCMKEEIEACGFRPITVLLYFTQKCKAKPVFLKYLNSGDTSGTVSYTHLTLPTKA